MKEDKIYNSIAGIYDHLMSTVNYDEWGKYLNAIISEFGVDNYTALELGGGTGKLASLISDKFDKYYLTDISTSMLKNSEILNVKKIACDMKSLPFNSKFDFIVCAFDTINYLLSKEHLREFFIEIFDIMHSNSVFTFDVSLELNSRKYLEDMNRSGIHNGIKYNQISEFNDETMIHSNIFEIELPDGQIIKEKHFQKIYDIFDYFNIIDSAGFWVVACFDCFSFDDINPDSERAQFVIKRM